MDSKKRVKIWNTFLKMARDGAVSLKQFESPGWKDSGYSWDKQDYGGTLGEEDMLKLSLLSCCILAAQARSSHLIQECKEYGFIDDNQAESFSHLNFRQQWLILPVIYMKPHCKYKIDFDQYPHKVIKKLHELRDNLFHVNHERLKNQLDKIDSGELLDYFVHFIDAMEDMNVIIERGGRTEARPEVLEIAKAFRK
jgi:hypothetical protein